MGFCSSLWGLCKIWPLVCFPNTCQRIVTLNIVLNRHRTFNIDVRAQTHSWCSRRSLYAVVPKTARSLRLWLWGETNVSVYGNAVAGPGSIPTAEEGARCNRLCNFFWRNWTFDRWTFPFHWYLSNRVVAGKWSRFHKVKKWPGSHPVDSSHPPPRLFHPGRWSRVLWGRPHQKWFTQRTFRPLSFGPQRF